MPKSSHTTPITRRQRCSGHSPTPSNATPSSQRSTLPTPSPSPLAPSPTIRSRLRSATRHLPLSPSPVPRRGAAASSGTSSGIRRSASILSTSTDDSLPTVEELVFGTRNGSTVVTEPDTEMSTLAPIQEDTVTTNSAEGADNAQWLQLRQIIETAVSYNVEADKQARVDAKIRTLNENISKICKAVKTFGGCLLCMRIMGTVFTTQCGHSFCGPCLRQHCEAKLRSTLVVERVVLRLPENTFKVPTSIRELTLLAELLEFHGVNAHQIFKYYCPSEICSHRFDKAPVLSYQHGEINKAMADAIRPARQSDLRRAMDVPANYLSHLFL